MELPDDRLGAGVPFEAVEALADIEIAHRTLVQIALMEELVKLLVVQNIPQGIVTHGVFLLEGYHIAME